MLVLGDLEWRISAAGKDGKKLGMECARKQKWKIAVQQDPKTVNDQLTVYSSLSQLPAQVDTVISLFRLC